MSNSENNNGKPTHSDLVQALRESNDDADKIKERDFQKKYYLSYLEYQKSTEGYEGPEQE